jgi:hypothetical protein
MLLDYFALFILVVVAVVIFYGIIVIHDIPYEIAKHRNHPQQDALHVAGWVSLFTLHAIWPFLWIWATLYREDRGWGFDTQTQPQVAGMDAETKTALAKMRSDIDRLSDRLNALDKPATAQATQTQASE